MNLALERSGFLWLLLATAAYGLLHSLLAAHFSKRWAERVWGQAARRFYRLVYVALAGLGLLPLFALALTLPDQPLYRLPLPWAGLAVGLQAAAIFGLLRAVAQTGAPAFLGLRQLIEPSPLVPAAAETPPATGGLYRMVRHPIYSFSFCLLWLMPWQSWNSLALSIGFSIYMLVGIYFEERKLLAEFGPRYAEYRRRTKMLIPKVW